jgi:RNA polymerase sigma-70 factor (ECF subfamily)
MSVAVSTAVPLSDDQLIARTLGGEQELFEHLVHRYHRPVVAFIHRMVGDYETALDLTQEVFLKVYTALDRYDERYRFSTWLFKIASNHAIDYLRTRNGKMVSLDAGGDEMEGHPLDVASPVPSPEHQSIVNQRRAIIESVIAQLPVSFRQVIVLRHIADLSYEEIADITKLPLGTVKNRIFRAREALREQLLKMGIEGTE